MWSVANYEIRKENSNVYFIKVSQRHKDQTTFKRVKSSKISPNRNYEHLYNANNSLDDIKCFLNESGMALL